MHTTRSNLSALRTTRATHLALVIALLPMLLGVSTGRAESQAGDILHHPLGQSPSVAFLNVRPAGGSPAINPQSLPGIAAQVAQTYSANSYGGTSLIFATNIPILNLAQPASYYTSYHMGPAGLSPWDAAGEVYRDALVAAEAQNVDLSNYDYFVLFSPKVWSGSFSAMAQEGIGAAVTSSGSPDLIEHELGHHFTLEHAAGYESGNPADPFAPNGILYDRGDAFDVMGGRENLLGTIPGTRHMSPANKQRLGWLNGGAILTLNAQYPVTTIALRAIEDAPGDLPAGEYMGIRIPRTPIEDYFVFYRRTPSTLSGVVSGPVVTTVRNGGSTLYDMNPDSTLGNWNTPPGSMDLLGVSLQPSQTLSDPSIGMTLKNLPTVGSNVQVEIGRSAIDAVDRIPVIDVLSPALHRASWGSSVNYDVTAFDPDVGTASGNGIQQVKLELFLDKDVSGPAIKSVVLPTPNIDGGVYRMTVTRAEILAARSIDPTRTVTYVLRVVAKATNGAVTLYKLKHWRFMAPTE